MVRIIGGTFKGRRLRTFRGPKVRLTKDIVKEALFDILGKRIVGASFLDLYAGSGSIGIEALSRGAGRVAFCEKDPAGVDVIKHNLAKLNYRDKCDIYRGDALNLLGKINGKFDIIFLDPPYNGDLLRKSLQILSTSGIIKEDGLVIAEHHKSTDLTKAIGSLSLTRQAKYGDTVLSFYRYPLNEEVLK